MQNSAPEVCPICGEGEFKPFADGVYTFKHGKKVYSVQMQQYAKCSDCGTSGFLPGQRAANRASIEAFQSQLTEFVSPSDVLAVRERYSLTQKQASQIFRGGVNGFSKWERGITFPSGATAMLIKVALASFDAMKELARIAQVDFPIIDNKLTRNEGASVGASTAASVVMCTHMEYADDVGSEAIESGYNDEDDDEWITLNEKKTTRTMSSLN